ncbi:MAG TPA: hypothetical protein VH025_03185 [Solirubrobacteraceae bacterium]|jgi:hypothetical protein|nr:hypothetical protein [Solirubrobacteraceae bacterium]
MDIDGIVRPIWSVVAAANTGTSKPLLAVGFGVAFLRWLPFGLTGAVANWRRLFGVTRGSLAGRRFGFDRRFGPDRRLDRGAVAVDYRSGSDRRQFPT